VFGFHARFVASLMYLEPDCYKYNTMDILATCGKRTHQSPVCEEFHSFAGLFYFQNSTWLTKYVLTLTTFEPCADSWEQVDASSNDHKYKIGNWVLERAKLVELDWDKHDS